MSQVQSTYKKIDFFQLNPTQTMLSWVKLPI